MQVQAFCIALFRAWPRKFETPSSRDRVRNACPVHSNFRRLQQALHSVGVGCNIVKSCRAASALAMCDTENVISLDPLSWSYSCAMGLCSACPELPLEIKEGVDLSTSVDFTQWKKGPSGRPSTSGDITSLFKVTMTISAMKEIEGEEDYPQKHQPCDHECWPACWCHECLFSSQLCHSKVQLQDCKGDA